MKTLIKHFLIITLICSGCSWIRVATKPVYDNEEKIPLTIGITTINENQETQTYGPMVVKYLEEFKIFNSIVYPYKEGDPVDGVLNLNIQGHWVKKGMGNLVVLCPILTPFLGPSMVAKHNTEASINGKITKVGSYNFQNETKIKHGVLANKKLVVLRGDSVQTYKIAYQIAGKMLMDQSKINKEIILNTDIISDDKKEKTQISVYAKNYFEVRFMDVVAAAAGSVSAIANGVTYASGGTPINNSNITSSSDHRKASGEFEKKLGDFDVLAYFISSIDKKKDSIKYYNLVLNTDNAEHLKTLKCINTKENKQADAAYTSELIRSNTRYISAIKFQYGIGARAGKEQFGMKKTYRPFVRIVGIIKDVKSNAIVWENKITIFSDKSYKGRDEAKEEFDFNLIKEFKKITDDLTKILIEDLNGKKYNFPEGLVDYTTTDDLL